MKQKALIIFRESTKEVFFVYKEKIYFRIIFHNPEVALEEYNPFPGEIEINRLNKEDYKKNENDKLLKYFLEKITWVSPYAIFNQIQEENFIVPGLFSFKKTTNDDTIKIKRIPYNNEEFDNKDNKIRTLFVNTARIQCIFYCIIRRIQFVNF